MVQRLVCVSLFFFLSLLTTVVDARDSRTFEELELQLQTHYDLLLYLKTKSTSLDEPARLDLYEQHRVEFELSFPDFGEFDPHLDPEAKYAYAYYATNDQYACAALVSIARLRELGAHPSIDFVIITGPKSLSAKTLQRALMNEVIVKKEDYHHIHGVYSDSHLKLHVFRLFEYTRLIYQDADSMIMRNLDALFQMAPCPLAMPDAFIREQTYFRSTLMVVTPTKDNWEAVELAERENQEKADMDIFNRITAFKDKIIRLPCYYSTLDSFFVRNTKKDAAFEMQSIIAWQPVYSRIGHIHFTSLGKPWQRKTKADREYAPTADLVLKLWDQTKHICTDRILEEQVPALTKPNDPNPSSDNNSNNAGINNAQDPSRPLVTIEMEHLSNEDEEQRNPNKPDNSAGPDNPGADHLAQVHDEEPLLIPDH